MRLTQIGTLIWTCFLVNPSSGQLLQIMMDQDPHAVTLAKWIMGLTPDEVVALLTMKMAARANDSGDDRSVDQDDKEDKSTTILERLWFAVESRESMVDDGGSQVDMLAHVCFFRSILRSALVVTRVSGFPWHQVAKTATNDATTTTVSTAVLIPALAGSYCRLLYSILVVQESNDAQASPPTNDSGDDARNAQLPRPRDAVVMCVDALSTIESGCRRSDDRTLEAVRQQVRELQVQLTRTDRKLSGALVPWTMRLLETIQA